MNIKKIILEEIGGSNELDWIKDIDPLSGGEYFGNSKSICFGDDGKYCDVRVTNEYITFMIDIDDFIYFWDRHGYWDEDEWILRRLCQNDTPYDGDGDWYGFDSDEFNYSYYRLTQGQKNRFNEILRTVGSGDSVDDFQDSMLDLLDELVHPELAILSDNLVNEYLDTLGYVIQRNRWLSISDQYSYISKRTGVKLTMHSDDIEIKIPTQKAHKNYYNNGVNDLTELLKAIIEQFSEHSWYELFMDVWDTEGGNTLLGESFNNFLDSVEEYLLGDAFKKRQKVLYGFETAPTRGKLMRKNPNDGTIWVVTFMNNYTSVNLDLHNINDTNNYRFDEPIKRHSKIPVEEIQKYIKPL